MKDLVGARITNDARQKVGMCLTDRPRRTGWGRAVQSVADQVQDQIKKISSSFEDRLCTMKHMGVL
jgi:hypothetical protein